MLIKPLSGLDTVLKFYIYQIYIFIKPLNTFGVISCVILSGPTGI